MLLVYKLQMVVLAHKLCPAKGWVNEPQAQAGRPGMLPLSFLMARACATSGALCAVMMRGGGCVSRAGGASPKALQVLQQAEEPMQGGATQTSATVRIAYFDECLATRYQWVWHCRLCVPGPELPRSVCGRWCTFAAAQVCDRRFYALGFNTQVCYCACCLRAGAHSQHVAALAVAWRCHLSLYIDRQISLPSESAHGQHTSILPGICASRHQCNFKTRTDMLFFNLVLSDVLAQKRFSFSKPTPAPSATLTAL